MPVAHECEVTFVLLLWAVLWVTLRNNWKTSVLSCRVGDRDQAQVVSRGGKHLYPLSRLVSPPSGFFFTRVLGDQNQVLMLLR